MSSAETVVIAGAGNLAQYLVEELIDDAKYRVAVISRSSRPSLDALGVDIRIVKEYSRESVLPILDSLPKTRALISTLRSNDPTVYTPLHEALLSACRDSKTCKRFIPSEFLGNTRDYETITRGIYRARRDFRAILTSQKDVTFSFVNLGWLADYFVQAPGSYKTYIRPFPQGWPIDLEKRTVRVIGTGDEPIGWTATRDMARAVVALIPHDDWPEYAWVYGELGTWNQAIQKVEKFYGIELQREYVSKESISARLSNENEPDKWYSATIDEWSLVGATAVPRQEADQQREKYFKDVGFRDIEALLLSSQHVPVV